MSQLQGDPIAVAVISNRLTAITKEMGQIMLLTSRSPIFSESRDFVTAIFDAQGRLVAQTSYIPVLLGAIPFALQSIRDRFEAGELHPGDVIIGNDPYQGNSHLPDVTIARPVFYRDQLIFWAVTKGHQADLGGGGVAGYNPRAKTVWEEGLRLPPIKLYSRGKYQRDIWDFILLNVKSPHLVEGDLHCQIGATLRGEEALIELLDRHGAAAVEGAIDAYLAATERAMAAAIKKIPDGSYAGESRIDNDGFTTVSTTGGFVRENGDLIKRFLKGLGSGIRFFKDNKKKSMEILSSTLPKERGGGDKEMIEYYYRDLTETLTPTLYPTMDAIYNVYAEACRYNPAAKRVNPLELWDLHFLRQLRDAREL
jgi:N-methylhydantoinase B/oxoprolinase/acetone carboxylase alpha subunit